MPAVKEFWFRSTGMVRERQSGAKGGDSNDDDDDEKEEEEDGIVKMKWRRDRRREEEYKDEEKEKEKMKSTMAIRQSGLFGCRRGRCSDLVWPGWWKEERGNLEGWWLPLACKEPEPKSQRLGEVQKFAENVYHKVRALFFFFKALKLKVVLNRVCVFEKSLDLIMTFSGFVK